MSRSKSPCCIAASKINSKPGGFETQMKDNTKTDFSGDISRYIYSFESKFLVRKNGCATSFIQPRPSGPRIFLPKKPNQNILQPTPDTSRFVSFDTKPAVERHLSSCPGSQGVCNGPASKINNPFEPDNDHELDNSLSKAGTLTEKSRLCSINYVSKEGSCSELARSKGHSQTQYRALVAAQIRTPQYLSYENFKKIAGRSNLEPLTPILFKGSRLANSPQGKAERSVSFAPNVVRYHY